MEGVAHSNAKIILKLENQTDSLFGCHISSCLAALVMTKWAPGFKWAINYHYPEASGQVAGQGASNGKGGGEGGNCRVCQGAYRQIRVCVLSRDKRGGGEPPPPPLPPWNRYCAVQNCILFIKNWPLLAPKNIISASLALQVSLLMTLLFAATP